MSEKDREDAIDDLENVETTEEHEEEAQALSENTSSSGGSASGSVVTKYQLCGRYCGGCPHGPYAWSVDDDGWHYLGKVGGDGEGGSENSSTQRDEEIADELDISPESLDEYHLESGADIGDLVLVDGYPARIKSAGKTENNRTTVHIEYLNPPRDSDTRQSLPTKLVRSKDGTLNTPSEKVDLAAESALPHVEDMRATERDVHVAALPDDVTDDISRYTVYGDDGTVETGKSVPKNITLDTVTDGGYGSAVAIKSSYSDKDTIKALDWEDTHRKWDGQQNRWVVDLDSVDHVIEDLTDAGNTVSARMKS